MNMIMMINISLVTLLVILVVASICWLFIWLWWRVKEKKILKNIPDKLIQEVKNGSKKDNIPTSEVYTEQGGNLETESGIAGETSEDIREPAAVQERGSLQVVSDSGTIRSKRATRQDWPSFSNAG